MESWIKHIFLSGFITLAISGFAFASDLDRPLIEPDVKPQKVDESLIDSENFELGVFAGVINIEDFESSFLVGARLAFHVSEDFFLEGNIAMAEAGETSAETFLGNVQLLTNDQREYTYYNVSLGYNLLPGEAFFAGKYAFNTNFYLVAGLGATEFADDNRLTYNVGAGYQILLTDWFSAHIMAREHLYDIDLLGEKKTSKNTEYGIGLSIFF